MANVAGLHPFECAERHRALDRRFVRVAVDEFVDVAHRHPPVEHAGDCARRVARRRNAAADGEIAGAPRGRREDAGEIPALHLLVEHHAHAVRQLRVQERTRAACWWAVPSPSSG